MEKKLYVNKDGWMTSHSYAPYHIIIFQS